MKKSWKQAPKVVPRFLQTAIRKGLKIADSIGVEEAHDKTWLTRDDRSHREMTLEEWGAIVSGELARAGFAVGSYDGFPIVLRPAMMSETCRLLKFSLSVPVDRHIYAEGILFVPAGLKMEPPPADAVREDPQ